MSIISSVYADYANEVKNEWVYKLRIALRTGDLDEIDKVIEEIKQFEFSE